jgi:hypothetical protein
MHCVDLTLCSTSCCLFATSVNIHFTVHVYYMFQPNRPTSGVQVVVMKESAALLCSFCVLASDCSVLYGLLCCCHACVCFMVLLVC